MRFRFALVAAALVTACDPPPSPSPVRSASPATSEEPRAASSDPSPRFSVPFPPSLPPAFAAKAVKIEGKAMGTHLLLTTYPTPELDEETLRTKLQKGFDEVLRLEALMTTWKDDSEVSQINKNAGKQPVKVGPETLAVIKKSIWMSEHSEGVFDITFEAMHGLWKFDQDLEEKVPDKAAIEAKRKLIDYKQIVVDDAASTVFLKKAGMKMSLGGIAKGYAVDAASRVLEKEGIKSYFVQAGGDLYVRGRKPGEATYRVGVRDPRAPGQNDYFALLEVEDHAFSTAGDYERGFVKDGKRYHHIIDPRTGYPATASRSVTIWAKDAFTADAIDDAVFILGPEKGLKLVESIDDCGAVIVDQHNKVWVSNRLKDRLKILRDPTDAP